MNMQPASVMIQGRPHRGVNVECKCGVVTQVATADVKGEPKDQEFLVGRIVARKLEAKGWQVLKSKDGHSCPGCVAKQTGRTVIKIEKAIADTATKPTIVKDFKDMVSPTVPVRASDEPIAELTRENRRIILAKLEEVYVDEKTGYSPGWTDAKVASDLGIPRSWVAQLRADNFGPEGNEDIRIALEEARTLLADSVATIGRAKAVTTALGELERRAEKIERTIIEIEKGLRA